MSARMVSTIEDYQTHIADRINQLVTHRFLFACLPEPWLQGMKDQGITGIEPCGRYPECKELAEAVKQ